LSVTFSSELVQLAALGCGAVKDAKAIATLEEVLQGPSLGARRAACLALAAIGTDEALEVVARTLLSAEEDVRRAAAEALANDAREGHAMLKDGVTMSDILVRRAAAYGLGRVHESWASDLLSNLQVQDDQWVVRNAASEALEDLSAAPQRAPRRLIAPAESPWLIEFAGKEGLGLSPGAPSTDVLMRALRGSDPELRLAALPYFRAAPTEGVVAQLYDAMYGDDLELRESVFQLLWEIGASGLKLPNPSQYGYA
jgi:HEAT repeat protein